jgi:hypothetical protein
MGEFTIPNRHIQGDRFFWNRSLSLYPQSSDTTSPETVTDVMTTVKGRSLPHKTADEHILQRMAKAVPVEWEDLPGSVNEKLIEHATFCPANSRYSHRYSSPSRAGSPSSLSLVLLNAG